MSQLAITVPRLARRSLRHHWRIAVAIAGGVAVATAVITGALLVGDSMRGSLRDLTLQRLGQVGFAVIPGGFFDPQTVLPAGSERDAVAVIYFSRGVLETAPDPAAPTDSRSAAVRRAGAVQIIACDPDFWQFDNRQIKPVAMPDGQGVVLNSAAAAELGVQVGERVTVRFPKEQAVPADSPLGRNEAESEGLPRMKVVDIVPSKGLGRFSLHPSQAEPLNVYLSRSLVGDLLVRPEQANMLLIRDETATTGLRQTERDSAEIEAKLRPKITDFGLQLTHVQRTFDGQPIIDYFSLSSDRLMISDEVRDAVTQELGEDRVQPVMTYLANKIVNPKDDGKELLVPYSTLTAIDSNPSLPLRYTLPAHPEDVLKRTAETNDNESLVPLVLNDWAAERLDAAVGDRLLVTYFEPESSDGREVERQFSAVLTDIVPITKPQQPYRRNRPAVFDQAPTIYNDPDLTPTVPGVTDQESISDWDLPFQLERSLITSEDDVYWNEHRLTPKAFIPRDDGRRLFGSRFGDTTSLRIDPQEGQSFEELQGELEGILRSVQSQLGFNVLPLRAQQLAASSGTTPFDVLFLMLSTFVIFAALLLIALLLRLGLLARAKELGTLLATGWEPATATHLITREAMFAAIPGGIAGVLLGAGYAWVMLWGLRNWWVGAVTVPFLQFHWSVVSLAVGFVGGQLIAWGTIRLTARQLHRIAPRVLLSGQFGESQHPNKSQARNWLGPLAILTLLCSLALGGFATQLSGQNQAGVFVGAGMMMLVAILVGLYAQLSRNAAAPIGSIEGYTSLWRLAAGNAKRNPLRSTLTVGLMASACFLILAMSAFQLSPTDSGVGGFDLVAQTSQPFYRDLTDPLVQNELFGGQAEVLSDIVLVAARLRLGQDASCNNLYQATQPTVVGFPARLAELEETGRLPAFPWAATDARSAEPSPWRLLEQSGAGTADDPVPVVLDQATAMWALQMYGGVGEVRAFEFDDGRTRHFQVVGLLSNSVLQGMLLIGEKNFKRLFPHISGDQYFLIHAPGDQSTTVASLLEDRLGDVGMDVTDSRTVLGRLLAVQNTYLRTFQSLGGLGLLLGTIGLAIAQLRNVLERRGELAVMRAVGFTNGRLAACVLLEHAVLLLGGIGCGLLAALLAVVPYAWLGQAHLPIAEPLLWVAAILVVGMLSGFVVLYRVVRMPLVASLRTQ